MSKKGWICVIPLALMACQKSPGAYKEQGNQYEQGGQYGQEGTDGRNQQPGTQQPGTDGMQQPERFGQAPRADQPRNRPEIPQAVQTLQQDVAQLRGSAEVQHTDLARTLRDFSAALQTLPGAGATLTDSVSRIESYADRIEAAGATSNMQTRWARRALNEGVDALENYQKEQGYTGMADQFKDLRGQLDQINPDQPFAQQKDVFVNALDQISNVVVQVSAPRQEPGTR